MVTKTPAKAKTLHPLESGDVLSHDEFWRIYSERHDIKKAEHIRGVVYVPSPASGYHAHPHQMLGTWLGIYAGFRGLYSSDNHTVFLPSAEPGEEDDTLQPDVLLLAREDSTAEVDGNGYVRGAPDLVVEIAYTSASYDLHVKRDAYEAAGVREYIVWSTWEDILYWFRLVDGQYQRVEPTDGCIESSIFPGLVLDVDALLEGDYAAVYRHVIAAEEERPE